MTTNDHVGLPVVYAAGVQLEAIDVKRRSRSRSLCLNIFVGNLPFTATEDQVRDLFAEYGQVDRTSLVTDRETGRPRGFGFVEMSSGGEQALEALENVEMGGRTLNINEARPREDRGSRY